MALLTAQNIGAAAGTAIAFTAAAGGGDTFKPVDDQAKLLVNNGSGSSINVTVPVPNQIEGLAVSSRVVAVPAGAIKAIPLTRLYQDPADSLIDIAYSAVTTVTVAVVTG